MTDDKPERRFSVKKTIVYSLLPLVFLLCVLEVMARVAETWRPSIPTDIGLGFTPESRLFVPDKSRAGCLVTNPNKAVSTTRVQSLFKLVSSDVWTTPFRWQRFPLAKPEKTFRIFFLGESSVNYAQKQIQSMARRLEKRFPQFEAIEVINCGGCAYGSHRLVFVLSEVLQYEPDAIFLYLGHNEFEEQEQLRFADLNSVPLQKLVSQSAFLRTVRDRLALFQLQRIYDRRNQQIMGQTVVPWQDRHLSREQVTERMNAFQANIEQMVQMTRACNVPLVMGSIPSNLMKPELVPPDKERYAAEALPKFAAGDYEAGKRAAQDILMWASRHQSSDLENRCLRDAARKWGVPFADVENRVVEAEPHHVPGETLFADHCHLNGAGNDILASAYEEKAAELLEGAKPGLVHSE